MKVLQENSVLPLKLCGPEISNFRGGLESVPRYKELPYSRVASDLQGAATLEDPSSSPDLVAECGYQALLNADLVRVDSASINFVPTWIVPLLPRKLALKISRQGKEMGA